MGEFLNKPVGADGFRGVDCPGIARFIAQADVFQDTAGEDEYVLLDNSELLPQITLFDILLAIDGPVLSPLPVDDGASQDLLPAWRKVTAGIEEILRSVSLQDLLDQASKVDMYYI